MIPRTNQKPAPRSPASIDVEYRRSYGRQPNTGVIRNISLSGTFLEIGQNDLRASDKLFITFVVSGRKRKVQASVVWSNQYGCGLKFQPFNNRDVQIVDDLLYFVDAGRLNRRDIINDIFDKVS